MRFHAPYIYRCQPGSRFPGLNRVCGADWMTVPDSTPLAFLMIILAASTNHRDGFYRLANNAARMIIKKARGVESGTVIQSAPQTRLRPGNRDPG
ncbi:hypothetical protein Pcinc_001358 [Petrolisthes cinctipes]|uniref:Uncharacterized protein n=1 Tax=Petrolisthes cinctipes TaxID=88211 RepID=A0AAE1L613_PETCI|nr:hypothetical protein Pcinc_001358 [Petrolisthes cinctipes]